MSTKESFTAQAGRIARRGFTLTELMLVVVIVAILASLTMTVQRSAVESTRRERTIATIRKIDAALTSAYEKYQYRKPDVSSFIGNIEKNLENRSRGGEEFKVRPQAEKTQMIYHWVLRQLYRMPWLEWNERSFISPEDVQTVDNQFAPYILRTNMLREILLADFPDCFDEVN
ncbi:MAG: prepilin-type N-terminal cleavage/methylation domain-containing protein, partial [Kiritimatiellae bacterium]|nr:prepilin-type N-terminal cleavage/methylation domain-containing protein [Kiritimatiellia bacterium]